jgi:hypothetical protein
MVTQALQQMGLGRVALLARIGQRWEEIVGLPLAKVTSPEGIRGRVLFVTVIDAIWLQQLTFCQAQFLQKIRQILGEVPIVRLHFSLAAVSPPLCPATPEATELGSRPLSTDEEQQVMESTATITDVELRAAVRQAWRRGWGTKR